MQFASKLLDVGVAVTPGVGFGKCGEGYARITFTQPKERIAEACERIKRIYK
jgi:LL-diaminopimelate aminotransferase